MSLHPWIWPSLVMLTVVLLSLTSVAAQAVPKAAETEDQAVVQSAPVVHPKLHAPAKSVAKATTPKKSAKARSVKEHPAKARPPKAKTVTKRVKTNNHRKPTAPQQKRG